jgi:hypothetical protein
MVIECIDKAVLLKNSFTDTVYTQKTDQQIINNLINNVNIDQDKQSLCAIYILTTFTLVNNLAAESLPWLYQSVI